MDELLKHLQNQWPELMKDMDSPPPIRTVSVTSTRKASSS